MKNEMQDNTFKFDITYKFNGIVRTVGYNLFFNADKMKKFDTNIRDHHPALVNDKVIIKPLQDYVNQVASIVTIKDNNLDQIELLDLIDEANGTEENH